MSRWQFDEPVETGDVVYFWHKGKEVAGDVISELDDDFLEVDTLEFGTLFIPLNAIYRLEKE